MGLFKKLLNFDSFISLFERGWQLFTLAGFGAYLMTFLEGFGALPKIWQWFTILASFALFLHLIPLIIRKHRNFKIWRAAKDVNITISYNRKVISQITEDRNASRVQANCYYDESNEKQGFMFAVGTFRKQAFKEELIPSITITNHSDTPLFNIHVPVTVECGTYINEKDYKIDHVDDVAFFPYMKWSIKKNESTTIYFTCISDKSRILLLNLKGYIYCSMFGSEKPVTINYLWDGYNIKKFEIRGIN